MSVNSEIYNAYNLYIIENIHAIVPRGNFTKEIKNFKKYIYIRAKYSMININYKVRSSISNKS